MKFWTINFICRQIGTGIPLRGHSGPVQAVNVLPNENLVISASHDNTMRAWKISDYTCAAIYRYDNDLGLCPEPNALLIPSLLVCSIV